ncbi:MAG: sig1 [Oscillospiraceae bacterium]|nr:sig1 [Oscillospiraceae bacterium]
MNETPIADGSIENRQEKMEQWYRETSRMAYYTALSILKNDADAQDAVQNSYIDAFSKFDQLQNPSAFASWLKRIVINNCINMRKKKKPELFKTNEEAQYFLDNIPEQNEEFLPEEYIVKETKRKQIIKIIDMLPELQQTTILLRYYDELSVKDIAEVMECSESTVTSRISYAKK